MPAPMSEKDAIAKGLLVMHKCGNAIDPKLPFCPHCKRANDAFSRVDGATCPYCHRPFKEEVNVPKETKDAKDVKK